MNDEVDDLGLIDVGEQIEVVSNVLVGRLQDVVERENENTAVIQSCSEDIDRILRFGMPDQSGIKSIMKRSAESMNELAGYFEDCTAPMEQEIGEMARLIDADLRIRLEFDNPAESSSDNIKTLEQFGLSIEGSVQQLNDLIINTQNLPRLSSDVNKAKKRLVNARVQLRDAFASLHQSVKNSLEYFHSVSKPILTQ